MKRFTLIIIFIFMARPVFCQLRVEGPLSPRNANYTMDIRLDAEKKQIEGKEILIWRNISGDVIRELQFHLYPNAFKNNKSTYMRERGGRAEKLEEDDRWGWIDVHRFQIVNGPDLTDAMEFIQPDDDNVDDQTVMRVLLPRPVYPGREIRIEIDFTTQLPIVFERNGYYKDFFFAAQWFPKIGVYIDGKWNCHQYHTTTEFFADYGVYDVNLTVPESYIVGASGIRMDEKRTGTEKTVTFRAEDVHDFAWTAWPHYQVEDREYRGVDIRLMYDKDHRSSVNRYFEAVEHDLDWFGDHIAEYPYSNVTVIDPPTGTMAVGGMEYPTFITGGSLWNCPKGIRLTEFVTIHEFGHIYWYGIVGNNEFEEAWLDEGINSYVEARIIDYYYGEKASLFDIMGIRMGELDNSRGAYIQIPRHDRTLRDAWTYIGGGYGTLSYQKPTLMLYTLENLIGRETMDRILKTFYERWKFDHPRSDDFIDVVEEVTGADYDWYFDQALKNSLELDFRLATVSTRQVREQKGFFDAPAEKVLFPLSEEADSDSTEEKEKHYRSVVRVQRKGEFIIPVDVLMIFADGDSVRERWDGKERWVRYTYERPDKLVSAVVDPDQKLVLDSNFANNSRTIEPQKKAVNLLSVRFLYWFESLLHLISFFG